jgi:cobalt-precorrin-5B (C1)-methyltransferase
MGVLAAWAGDARVAEAPTAMAALALGGPALAARVAAEAQARLSVLLDGSATDVVVVDRAGAVVAWAGP